MDAQEALARRQARWHLKNAVLGWTLRSILVWQCYKIFWLSFYIKETIISLYMFVIVFFRLFFFIWTCVKQHCGNKMSLHRLERAKKLQEQKEKELLEKQQQQQQEIAAGQPHQRCWLLKWNRHINWSFYSFFFLHPHSCCCGCCRRLKPWAQCGSPPGLRHPGDASDCCGSSDGSTSGKNTGRNWYRCAQLLQPIFSQSHEVCRAGEKEEKTVAGKEGWGKNVRQYFACLASILATVSSIVRF